MSHSTEALVLDALFNRGNTSSEGCFTHNIAGVTLAQSGAEAIPWIERVLRDRVATSPSYDTFEGLKYVLGAYALICTRTGYTGLQAFLASLPAALQLEGLYALFAFFKKLADGYNFGVPPGAQVIDYLRLTTKNSDPTLKKESEELLKKFESER